MTTMNSTKEPFSIRLDYIALRLAWLVGVLTSVSSDRRLKNSKFLTLYAIEGTTKMQKVLHAVLKALWYNTHNPK